MRNKLRCNYKESNKLKQERAKNYHFLFVLLTLLLTAVSMQEEGQSGNFDEITSDGAESRVACSIVYKFEGWSAVGCKESETTLSIFKKTSFWHGGNKENREDDTEG